MKNLSLLLALFTCLHLFSQEDDYCICEETQDDMDYFNNMMSSTDDAIYLPEDNNQFILLESEEPITDLYVPNDDPTAAVGKNDAFKRKGPSGIYPIRSHREAMKRKIKGFANKKRRQARKRSYRYRGGCPVFR